MNRLPLTATVAAAALAFAVPSLAQTGAMMPQGSDSSAMMPEGGMTASSPSDFVSKAGASDQFEIQSAKVMANSTNPKIKMFARKMITDHTKSTMMVKTAAKADKVPVTPPVLNATQASNLAQLKSASGTSRDQLYLQQQATSHQQALGLTQDYASNGNSPALKAAATKIAPIVQSHIDMLNKISAA